MHMVHALNLAAIDLNLLVVLRALLTERHVTRAASRIGLSQSATSHALSRLRELYGDQLLVRSGKSLRLTPRAERLLPLLDRGLSDLKATVDPEPVFDPRTARRSFTIGTADYGQAVVLPELLRVLEREAPHIELSSLTFPNLEELVIAGTLDLSLDVVSPGSHSRLRVERLFSDDFVCVMRKGRDKRPRKLSLEQYLKLRHLVVAPSGTPGSLVDTELEKRGLSRQVALRVSSFLVAPIVLGQTDYVSTLPRRLAESVAPRHRLTLMTPPIELQPFTLGIVWHPRLESDPAQAWLRGVVARVGAKL
jgi:DNA-binding transcriptional LysR family regulator